MLRSHHTMCTLLENAELIKGGYKLCTFKTYIFGGLVFNPDTNLLETTNDLIEIITKAMVSDPDYDGDVNDIM